MTLANTAPFDLKNMIADVIKEDVFVDKRLFEPTFSEREREKEREGEGEREGETICEVTHPILYSLLSGDVQFSEWMVSVCGEESLKRTDIYGRTAGHYAAVTLMSDYYVRYLTKHGYHHSLPDSISLFFVPYLSLSLR